MVAAALIHARIDLAGICLLIWLGVASMCRLGIVTYSQLCAGNNRAQGFRHSGVLFPLVDGDGWPLEALRDDDGIHRPYPAVGMHRYPDDEDADESPDGEHMHRIHPKQANNEEDAHLSADADSSGCLRKRTGPDAIVAQGDVGGDLNAFIRPTHASGARWQAASRPANA